MKGRQQPLPDDPLAIIKEIGRYGVSYREIGQAIGCSKTSIAELIGGRRMLRSWGEGELARKLGDLLARVKTTRAIVERRAAELMMIREPIAKKTMRHFELESDPFDIDEGEYELWLDDERTEAIKQIEKAAAKHGFVAVIGPCGAGKTVILKEALRRIEERGDAEIIRLDPNMNQELSFWRLLERILMHFQEETNLSYNKRIERAKGLLAERLHAGGRTLLAIEEAQMLKPDVLRGFKRLWEWSDDRGRRLLGIALAGQPGLAGQSSGLKNTLLQNINLREIALRIVIIEFQPLSVRKDDARLDEYLRFRIRNVKDGSSRLFTNEAINEMKQRLNGASHPLVINVLAAKCLNLAAARGKKIVDEEIVKAVRAG